MKQIDRRLAAVSNLQIMCRITLTASLILSVLILLAQFNAYFSWYRDFATEDFDKDAKGEARPAPVPHLRKEVVNQWLEGRSFRIPFIDIPILPSDIGVLGGLSLCMTTMFFLLYGRREHIAIGHLLHDAQREPDPEAKAAVLHSVLSGVVFVTFSSRTKPYDKLEEIPELPDIGPAMRWPSWILIMFPALAALLSVGADVYSYMRIDSPFRGYPPVRDFEVNGASFVFRLLISIAFVAWAGYNCHTVVRFQEATGELISEFRDKVQAKRP